MGLGVQGLADAFLMMMPFESPEAKQLNEETDAGEALMLGVRVRVVN